MGTATDLGAISGFAGEAHCYKMDPPLEGEEFVTIWVQDSFGSQGPEAVVVAAKNEFGAPKSMTRLTGSYVGKTPTHSGALFLNGYTISPKEEE